MVLGQAELCSRKMTFPEEKCTLLQRDTVFRGGGGAHGRKQQEITVKGRKEVAGLPAEETLRILSSLILGPSPDLLCFFGKRQGKPPKKQGFFIVAEPLKSLGKKGKTRKKARNSLERQKARKSKKARKRRLGSLR